MLYDPLGHYSVTDDDDVYFNAVQKVSRYYYKYSARKWDEFSTPTVIYKLKVEDKPKEKEKNIGNKCLISSITL